MVKAKDAELAQAQQHMKEKVKVCFTTFEVNGISWLQEAEFKKAMEQQIQETQERVRL